MFQQPKTVPNRQSYTWARGNVAKSGVTFPSPLSDRCAISPKVGRECQPGGADPAAGRAQSGEPALFLRIPRPPTAQFGRCHRAGALPCAA